MDLPISLAGIKQRDDGTREVPASKRSDGTVRAPIRIRPGYVPAADKPKYRPPKTREPTTMDEPASQSDKIPGIVLSKTQTSHSARSSPTASVSENVKNNKSATLKTNVRKNQMHEENQSMVSVNGVKKSEPGVNVKANQKLSAWSSSGWHGTVDSPSRYAKPSPEELEIKSAEVPTESNTNTEEASKPSRPPRRRAGRQNKKSSIPVQHEQNEDEEYLMLEAELNKMKIRG
ncbi:protein of unknown function [Taphrina deformans PYCC 5710]|uniref:WIBG Mago-binding domain-containing protein n=1 Tax=Taphrina deformans (strain PYCC 5710 / ATCC 11124 / CBS 356.35 / IMI 108563 / JCM 9778 / NBRC 8474) TaxID=1097556 RepID=R4XGL2_TAPDE|nr:protein of unknown function [Taphrina deformans PYCC 5710]|eukprot:CCG85032.1 protein of unknown function [Taphrina deformans PYCC 5710]